MFSLSTKSVLLVPRPPSQREASGNIAKTFPGASSPVFVPGEGILALSYQGVRIAERPRLPSSTRRRPGFASVHSYSMLPSYTNKRSKRSCVDINGLLW